ncbi:putative repeat protein (TIGR01451 family), partial [Flavobacterium sp. HSC-32F16]|nr:putative repeat protein (TIGR01451 family) [Flavobacterium sp. HSC-32F16]
MCPKSLLFTRSLFLKLSFILFLITLNVSGQSTVSRIYTDWKGYWSSNSSTSAGNRPDLENNLIGFNWNGKTYSTGVNDGALDTHSVTYDKQKFRALKIQSLGSTTGTYFLQGSMIDGSNTVTRLEPAIAGSTATGAELASRLTDGVNGLSLGTGVANIRAGSAEFKIGTNNLNTTGINDGTPDLIVTQVAEYGGTPDKFKFIDASGNTVGKELSITFNNSTPSMGTYSLDLFSMNGAYAFTPAATRELRMIAIETSEFEINASNASLVDRFVVTFSGSSDCAFIAFNTNSLKIAELQLLKTASMPSCGTVGSTINYTFEVKNPGEVPITDIRITDPKPITYTTGNSIASLGPGATATLTGTYTVTAADVTSGRVTNSAKVAGTDPSLNVVEDISGTSFTNDTPTSIDLLSPPTIGTTVNTTCTDLGTVVLNNLPPIGNWEIQRSPDGAITRGSGTSTTITGLTAGTTYSFRVTNVSGCKSPSSATVSVTNQSSTTWNGTSWSNGDPNSTKSVIFTGPYTFTTDFYACSCTVNSPVSLTVPSGITLNITNSVNVNTGGSLIFNNNSSLMQSNKNAVNSGDITY